MSLSRLRITTFHQSSSYLVSMLRVWSEYGYVVRWIGIHRPFSGHISRLHQYRMDFQLVEECMVLDCLKDSQIYSLPTTAPSIDPGLCLLSLTVA